MKLTSFRLPLLALLVFFCCSAIAERASDNPDLLGPANRDLHNLSELHLFANTGADPSKLAIKGYVMNNCPFRIYVQYAWCCTDEKRRRGDKCVDPLHEVKPGVGYWTSGVARNDRCSQTIRVWPDRSLRDVYQVEYSMDPNGLVWYNLSAVDGNPFVNYRRFLKIRNSPETCKWMYCAPGVDSRHCDWPHHEGVCDAGDAMFYLC